MTAINLRRRLGLPAPAGDIDSMNVVVRRHGESFSFLVDDVGDVINVESERLEPVPGTLDAHWKSLTQGVFRLEGRLFLILNPDAVLQLS